jgi:hypothetical protein
MVGGAVLIGWLALAALHLRDEYRIAHLQGVWIAAAESARTGHFYPPLFDGQHYAGTRWMPLAILGNALAAGTAGDPLVGGKLLAAVLMAVLLALCVILLRHLRCPWALSVALAAGVVATDTGLQAGTSIGGDVLPVVLQLGALAVVLRRQDGVSAAIAGVLAALAVASKLTGLWALLAIVTWFMARGQRRFAGIMLATTATTGVVVLGSVQLLTHGGLFQHLLAFSIAGIGGASSVTRAPNQLLYNLRESASGTIVLLPLAALGALLSSGWRQLSLLHLALVFAVLLALVVYTDAGTGSNQLFDIVVLTALAAGHLAGDRQGDTGLQRDRTVLAAAVAVAAVWATGLDLVRTVGFDLRRSIVAARGGDAPPRATARVAALVQPAETVLAEDPAIDVALGRRPVVMDPYMLTRLDRAHPEWVDPLIAQIAERRFALVVLLVPLDDRSLDYWWNDYHFGPRIAKALRTSYRFERLVGRYYLYRPQPHTVAGVPQL